MVEQIESAEVVKFMCSDPRVISALRMYISRNEIRNECVISRTCLTVTFMLSLPVSLNYTF